MVDYLVNIVVEVDVASAEVTSKHRGVSREDRSDIDVASATDDQTDAGDPLVEVCYEIRRAVHVFLVLADTREDSMCLCAWTWSVARELIPHS